MFKALRGPNRTIHYGSRRRFSIYPQFPLAIPWVKSTNHMSGDLVGERFIQGSPETRVRHLVKDNIRTAPGAMPWGWIIVAAKNCWIAAATSERTRGQYTADAARKSIMRARHPRSNYIGIQGTSASASRAHAVSKQKRHPRNRVDPLLTRRSHGGAADRGDGTLPRTVARVSWPLAI